jgi:hypothetical protein
VRPYYIACHICFASLLIGDSPPDNRNRFHTYGGNFAEAGPQYSPLAEFLIAHEGHPLRFVSDVSQAVDESEFLRLQVKPGLPPEPDDLQPSCYDDDLLKTQKELYVRNAGKIIEDPK